MPLLQTSPHQMKSTDPNKPQNRVLVGGSLARGYSSGVERSLRMRYLRFNRGRTRPRVQIPLPPLRIFFLVLGGVDIVFGVFCGAGMCFWCVWFFFWWFVVFLVCSEVEGGEKSRKSKGEEPSVARSTQRGIESDKNHLKWR